MRRHASRGTQIVRRARGANPPTARRRRAVRQLPAIRRRDRSAMRHGRRSAPHGLRSLHVPQMTARRGPRAPPCQERHPVRLPAVSATNPGRFRRAPKQSRPAHGTRRARRRIVRAQAPTRGVPTSANWPTNRAGRAPTNQMSLHGCALPEPSRPPVAALPMPAKSVLAGRRRPIHATSRAPSRTSTPKTRRRASHRHPNCRGCPSA